MNEPLWVLLLKVFGGPLVSGLVAAGITYWLSRRRFIGERWWDRKADAYGNIIGSLVELIHSLNLWIKDEYSAETNPRYEYSQERAGVIHSEFNKARTQIERAATEGDYVISEKASNALSELMKTLELASKDFASPKYWLDCLHIYREAAKSCLEVIRAEARSDLRVK